MYNERAVTGYGAFQCDEISSSCPAIWHLFLSFYWRPSERRPVDWLFNAMSWKVPQSHSVCPDLCIITKYSDIDLKKYIVIRREMRWTWSRSEETSMSGAESIAKLAAKSKTADPEAAKKARNGDKSKKLWHHEENSYQWHPEADLCGQSKLAASAHQCQWQLMWRKLLAEERELLKAEEKSGLKEKKEKKHWKKEKEKASWKKRKEKRRRKKKRKKEKKERRKSII